ncbi:MAG: flagellar biosynthesis protein FlhB [Clostridia bacterium]|nr:flagellar biosynthesis protein FlhB [Clostridia bacterium]
MRIDLQLFAQEEKTEEATPHKRRQVRKEGQVAKSTDLNAAVTLFAVFLLILFTHRYYIENLYAFVSRYLSHGALKRITDSELMHIFADSSLFFIKFMAPIFLMGMAAGLAVNLGQVGFLFAPLAIKPKLSNINPINGFKRIFSRRSLVELVKSLLKVAVIGWVTYVLAKKNFENLVYLMFLDLLPMLEMVINILSRVVLGAVGAFLVIAVLDYIYQRYDFRKRIRMTRKEVKDEFKQTEGDPLIKSRQREKQRLLAQRRMMEAVPEATVVITNPTHLAVALKYEVGEQDAPEVVAKGAGYIAEKIVQRAKENDVPVVENKPVAQFIYHNVEIGQEIPPELYKAVAEILAVIYRFKRKKPA